MNENVGIVLFTVQMAALGTLLVAPPAIFLGYALARWKWRGKSLVETIVMLPLVIPPVATGVLLLRLVGRRGWIGALFERLTGSTIVFTWRAVVLAMAVMSAPLLVRAARVAFEEVDRRLEDVARTLGAGRWEIFRRVTLPLARRGVIAGCVLAFARALGEFGATVMVAGNIPGRTATLSLSIYNRIELGQDDAAMTLVAVSLLLALCAVLVAELLQRKVVAR